MGTRSTLIIGDEIEVLTPFAVPLMCLPDSLGQQRRDPRAP